MEIDVDAMNVFLGISDFELSFLRQYVSKRLEFFKKNRFSNVTV